MSVIKSVFLCLTIFFSNFAFSDATISQLIGPLNYNGDSNTVFFRGSMKWGAAGCPNATYVQVLSNVSGRKEILSIALAAKMAGKKVEFLGSCNADLDYFDAVYIIIQ